jgi:hypothetical protein
MFIIYNLAFSLENSSNEHNSNINTDNNNKNNINLSEINESPIKNYHTEKDNEISNKMFSLDIDNTNVKEKQHLEKKNSFKFNFLEYCLYNVFCIKNKKFKTKARLLENSMSFYDYYLDINSYVKKMIEIDLLKLYLIKNQEDLTVINNFKPALTNNYDEEYLTKINENYINRIKYHEQDNLLQNVTNMTTNNSNIYKTLLSFY